MKRIPIQSICRVSEATSSTTAWWSSFFPGLAIFLVVMSLNFMGDWISDFTDPRLDNKPIEGLWIRASAQLWGYTLCISLDGLVNYGRSCDHDFDKVKTGCRVNRSLVASRRFWCYSR